MCRLNSHLQSRSNIKISSNKLSSASSVLRWSLIRNALAQSQGTLALRTALHHLNTTASHAFYWYLGDTRRILVQYCCDARIFRRQIFWKMDKFSLEEGLHGSMKREVITALWIFESRSIHRFVDSDARSYIRISNSCWRSGARDESCSFDRVKFIHKRINVFDFSFRSWLTTGWERAWAGCVFLIWTLNCLTCTASSKAVAHLPHRRLRKVFLSTTFCPSVLLLGHALYGGSFHYSTEQIE